VRDSHGFPPRLIGLLVVLTLGWGFNWPMMKIALGEKGVPFETRLPDILGGSDAETFAKLNPRREVPALLDGETAVFDSTIILEYIEDKWPTPALLPATPGDRARGRMIEELCDTHYEPVNWAIMEIRAFGRATGEAADRLLGRAAEQTAGIFAWLTRQLGAHPYFNGPTFGWADLGVAPLVNSSAFMGNGPAPGSPLGAWLERVRARPTVATVFQAALDSMTGFEMLPQLVESGHFKREYRDHRLEWMVRNGGIDIVLEGLRKQNIRFTHELS